MAQYITTLTFGTLSLHLSHTGQQVFSSRHYTTGGSSVGGIVFRRGQFCAAGQPASSHSGWPGAATTQARPGALPCQV